MRRRTFFKQISLTGAGAIVAAGTSWARTKGQIARQDVTLEQAWALHKKCLIFDGHNDDPVERLEHEMPLNWMGKSNVYHTDMKRARENGQKYVAFMIMAPGRGTTEQAFRNMAELAHQVEQHPKDLAQVLSSADALAAAAAGKVGIINAIEGCFGPLAGDLENLKKFYAKGLRLAGISHGEGGADPKYLQGARSGTNHIAPAVRAQNLRTMSGLTPFGIEVLKLSNLLGIVTDLAHINDKAFFDVVERSTLPPIVSHTDVYSICQVGRCVTDDQIKVLAQKGGVMGMTFVPEYVDNEPRKVTNIVDRYVDHICYVADLVGVDYVAVGSDFDGGVSPLVIPDVSGFVQITRAMMARGFAEEEIQKIWSGNWLRIMKKVVDI